MIPKCPKCRKRFVEHKGDLCEFCAFVPKVGKLLPGYVPATPKREDSRRKYGHARRNDI